MLNQVPDSPLFISTTTNTGLLKATLTTPFLNSPFAGCVMAKSVN